MSLRWLCHLSAFSHLLLVLLEELPVCEVISWDRAVGLGPGALVRETLGGDALPSPAGPLKPLSGLTHHLPQPPPGPPWLSAQLTVRTRCSQRTCPIFLSNTFTCPLPTCGTQTCLRRMFSTPGGMWLSLDILHMSLQRREGGSFLATGAALLGKRLMRIIGYTRGQQAGTADGCQDRYSQFCPLRPLCCAATTSRGTRALGPLCRHLVHRCVEAKNSLPLCASAGKVPGHRKGPPMCGYCLQPYNTASKMTTTRHQLCKATQEPLLPSRPQTCQSPPESP